MDALLLWAVCLLFHADSTLAYVPNRGGVRHYCYRCAAHR